MGNGRREGEMEFRAFVSDFKDEFIRFRVYEGARVGYVAEGWGLRI
jgi:hypothetical protein